MNVLSLFDGLSGARIALDVAGIKVDNYYASEIDKWAIKVAQENYPENIQLGSVVDLTEDQLKEMKIDLLIGGSPCQGFSVAGHMKGMSTKEGIDVTTLEQYLKLKEEGFEFDGQSYLFWEYIRVLRIIKPKYFLLENVRVQKKWKDIFDEVVGVEPIMINSALLSAQNRVRYYWTNIPNVEQPEDLEIMLKDVIDSGRPVLVGNQGKEVLKEDIEKSACLLARDYKGFGNQGMTAAEERPCKLREVKKDSLCIHIADAADINGHESIKRVYSDEGKSPTVNTCTGGNREVKVLCGASRGRYLVDGKRQDGKMLTAGKTEQYIEVRSDEKTNCLTTVEKDNYIVKNLKEGDRVRKVLVVPEATKKGYVEIEDGNCFDVAVPTSKTRRGRSMEKKSNALLISNQFMKFDAPTYRRLTPTECERLQTVPEEYTASVSNSQRYKMLGNGFTVKVIAHILKNMEDEPKDTEG